MTTKTYDPSDVLMTIGNIIVHGYADGTFLTTDKAEDTFTVSVGATGHTTRVRNRNESGTVTFVLQPSTLVNDALSVLHHLDLSNNKGLVPLLIKDRDGTTLIASEQAFIKKIPAKEFSKDMPTITWVVECPKLYMHIGGLNDII